MSDENTGAAEGQGKDILDEYVPDTSADVGAVAVDEEVAEPANRNAATGVITVTCGANTNAFGEISGRSIANLRQDLSDVLNIPREAKAIVSGAEVGEDYVLAPGDRVEFIKQSGQKG